MPKTRKPLSDAERFQNLSNALSEDSLADKTPLTKDEMAEAERQKGDLLDAAGQEADARWKKRTTRQKESSAPKKQR